MKKKDVLKKIMKIVVVLNKDNIIPLLTPILGHYNMKPPELLIRAVTQIIHSYPQFEELLLKSDFQEQTSIMSNIDMALTFVLRFNKHASIDIIDFKLPSAGFLFNFYFYNYYFDSLFFWKLFILKGHIGNRKKIKKLYVSLLITILQKLY